MFPSMLQRHCQSISNLSFFLFQQTCLTQTQAVCSQMWNPRQANYVQLVSVSVESQDSQCEDEAPVTRFDVHFKTCAELASSVRSLEYTTTASPQQRFTCKSLQTVFSRATKGTGSQQRGADTKSDEITQRLAIHCL